MSTFSIPPNTFSIPPNTFSAPPNTITFHATNKEVLRITHDGRLVTGEGLSADEATQEAAKLLIASFEEQIQRMVEKRIAAEREKVRVLREASQWVPVAERLPKTGRRVLVAALNGIHVWQTVAQYWPAGTMDASNWDDAPDDWWDEDSGKCTNPEPGWYESQIETETEYLLTGVSHWMTLPALAATKEASK